MNGQGKVQELIADLMTAASNSALYSGNHPAVGHLAEKSIQTMEGLYADDELSFTVLGDSLVFNGARMKEGGIHTASLIKRLRRNGIEKAVIKKGVTAGELREFITHISSVGKPLGQLPHISVGSVAVRLKPECGTDVEALMEENISKLKEVYRGASRFKKLDMYGLEDVVVSFLSTLRREANVLRVISPVKSYSEYTYTHATNVTILSIFQAESLGLEGEALYEIGLAGLLHDVGKMFISKEVLEKQGKLDDAEWAEMKMHPVLGASYLSTLSNLPKLAVVIAFEHHMKFDGSGYPGTKRRERAQHLISQIVAISDFFDALRTERPYRKALELPVVLGLIREASGKDFNPALVRNFIGTLERVKGPIEEPDTPPSGKTQNIE
jgi:HD-GYP domain-containing protein (c-di-GMP phosphodiesterase class II)